MNEDIKVTFIIPQDCESENDCSEDIKLAFIACEQHSGGGLQAKFVHASKYNKFDGLTKRDVFVLSQFEGELYEKLRNTKCLVVGPRCLLCCLTEGVPIPSGPEPVYTVAMRGLVITASGLTKAQKENIKNKVHWMGGIYKSVLTDDTTHLISDTVISDKYIKSVEKNIPIMSYGWLEAVWEASMFQNINGSSEEFNVHKLPPFANLQITTSGISKKDKLMIMKLVNENGGTFSGAFQSETTDVVVLNKDGVCSEKYKAALEYGKACVLPAWVKESACRGVALPLARYRVAGASTSSPLSAHRLPDMSLNFSRITAVKPPNNFVDETRSADVTTMSGKMKLSQESKSMDTSLDKEIVAEFENFDMNDIKKAGPIFDGFCIWVLGLTGVCRERAYSLISRCGGVRYSACDARVTHAVCAARNARTARTALPHVPVLSPLWLLRSVQQGKVLDEAEFLLTTDPGTPAKSSAVKQRPEVASPMSKRNLQLLRRGPLDLPPPAPTLTTDQQDERDELVNHYLSQQMPEEPKQLTPVKQTDTTTAQHNPEVTEDITDEPTDEIEQIFRGMKLEVQGLDEEALCELSAEVSAAGGVLCAAGAGASHALVPLDFDVDELLTKHAIPVTVFWVKDCLSQQELLPIQYYHRPVKLPAFDGPLPLNGVVASLSTYSGLERAFLDELAKLLGATTQLRFCRRNTANALASTHLICPEPSGDKYLGAVKWGLPAVSGQWLLKCAEVGIRVSEKPYLIGDTKAPPSPEPPVEQISAAVPSNQLLDNATNKENAMLPPEQAAAPRRASIPHKETPRTNEATDDMSPASRYIAMARQGLLGGDSQETPKRHDGDDAQKAAPDIHTPTIEDALSSPNLAALSPRMRRRLLALKSGDVPSDPIRTPVDPFDKPVQTPDSAFGALLRGGAALSPAARKQLWRVVRELPGKPEQHTHKQNTPLSEIRNRFLAQFNTDAPTTPPSDFQLAPRKLLLQDQTDTPPPAKMARMSLNQSPGSAMKTMNRTEQSKEDESKSAFGCNSTNFKPNVEVQQRLDATSPSNEEGSRSASVADSSVPPDVGLQLKRLNAALTGRLSNQRAQRRTRDRESITVQAAVDSEPMPDSQPNTVGWDDTTPAPSEQTSTQVKRFMISSNVDNGEEISEMIVYLGGEVSPGTELDPAATHLLCAAPGRSEKVLCSVAAGRWLLHPAYVTRSRAHGTFLPEEQFEWGNPLATCLPVLSEAEAALARAAHRWRAARGVEQPYRGVVALLHVPQPRHQLLARLVRAGGGCVPDIQPPYDDDSVTVCFADIKRCPLSTRDAAWLRSRRIPVCAPVLLSEYLTDETTPDPFQHCLPDFKI